MKMLELGCNKQEQYVKKYTEKDWGSLNMWKESKDGKNYT